MEGVLPNVAVYVFGVSNCFPVKSMLCGVLPTTSPFKKIEMFLSDCIEPRTLTLNAGTSIRKGDVSAESVVIPPGSFSLSFDCPPPDEPPPISIVLLLITSSSNPLSVDIPL